MKIEVIVFNEEIFAVEWSGTFTNVDDANLKVQLLNRTYRDSKFKVMKLNYRNREGN